MDPSKSFSAASSPALMERPGALRLKAEEGRKLDLLRGDTSFEHYPARAKRDAIDGIVVVDLLLNVEGQVQEAQVISESPPGHGFGLAALDAAKTFEFSNPYKRPLLLVRQLEFLP
jgi:TonB family protein